MNIQTIKELENSYLVNNSITVPKSEGNRDYQLVKQWIAEGNTPDPEFTDAEFLENAKNNKINICREYLRDSDWYSQRHADTGQPYPEEVRQKRADARSIQDSIKAATTVAELDAIDLSSFVL